MGGKKEKVFELILEIGHKATLLPKKLLNGYTHKWTVFVKGHNSSKIEHCIQKVVFQLHESFENPSRDITEPPFQIKEVGYAGFEIPIQVYFKNRDKPNHVVFVHDLCLLANKPNDSKTVEKIKFINPNKEFEKCLIRSGAQLLPVAIKKERSNSPPAKKHKSSSLIPSKDINNKPTQSQQSVPSQQSQAKQHNHHDQSQQHHHQHHHHHHNHQHHHKQQQQQKQSEQQKQQPVSQKPKSSKEFIDIFGPPLEPSAHRNKSKEKETHRVKQELPHSPLAPAVHAATAASKPISPVPPPKSVPVPHVPAPVPSPSPVGRAPVAAPSPITVPTPAPINDDSPINGLQLLQSKISSLSDSDRLQRIVDIIEEAGESFQLTSKKFQFDLDSFDKRTIYKIEKTLQNK